MSMKQETQSFRFGYITWFGWVYLVGLLVWFSLRLLFFDRFWWLALLNTLAFYLFTPAVLLLPLALWRRSSRLLVGLLLSGALFMSLFHPLLNPLAKVAPPAQPHATLKVMTFNLLWSNQDYPKIAQMIRTVQPDLIGIQDLPETKG